MPVVAFEIEPVASPLPPAVAAFIADAERRIDVFFHRRRRERRLGFFPSDFELGFRVLNALRRLDADARQFCEWGSGFGVVTGLGALLGYQVHGIELNPELVDASRKLLADHRLDATILHGSFIPEDYARTERLSDLETMTVLTGAEVYRDVDFDIDDFDVIFAYPWPNEEEQDCDIFDQFGDYGAVLLTYSMLEGMRAYRKVGDAEE